MEHAREEGGGSGWNNIEGNGTRVQYFTEKETTET